MHDGGGVKEYIHNIVKSMSARKVEYKNTPN